jgi:Arc/MetJ-type ribon-helix-helix transcriptional regulator
MPDSRVTVRMPGELKNALDAEASATGHSPSEIVRVALSRHLRKRGPPRTCLDVARELGVIGAAKDLPRDLSTNLRHFEGFGES